MQPACLSGYDLIGPTCYGPCASGLEVAVDDPTVCYPSTVCDEDIECLSYPEEWQASGPAGAPGTQGPCEALRSDPRLNGVCLKNYYPAFYNVDTSLYECPDGYQQYGTAQCIVTCPDGLLESNGLCIKQPIDRPTAVPVCSNQFLFSYSTTSQTCQMSMLVLVVLFVLTVLAFVALFGPFSGSICARK
jgi:hypothetical protein